MADDKKKQRPASDVGRPTPFDLIRSKRRSLELRVLEDGRLQVRAPRRLPRRVIVDFVASRESWIRKQRQRQASRPRQRWCDGAKLYFQGDPLRLSVVGGPTRVRQQGEVLAVTVTEPWQEAAVRAAVENWLRRVGRPVMEESIDRQFPWFAKRGHRRPVLRVKAMRTRWGSLSTRGYINLNLALLHYPPTVLDYVVMHELCHLEHRDHGPGFHGLMDRRMPDWRERKAVLDQPFYQP